MDNLCLAIPTVPMQQWNQTYPPEKGLEEGTIFPELNLPFYVAPEGSNTTLNKERNPHLEYAQICFAVDDTLLYLDTHPQDVQAQEYYKQCLEKKSQLQKQMNCGCCLGDHFAWEEKPLVWEGGHC